MDYKTFEKYARQGNLIPVFREKLADMETPVSVLSRFATDENVFLLESVEGGERFGRYSFIGISPRKIFSVKNGTAFLNDTPVGKGVFTLREELKKYQAVNVPGLPPLFGGAIGFIGYETINEFEELPAPKTPFAVPQSTFLMVDDMIIFDNIHHTVKFTVCVHTDEFSSLHEAYDHAMNEIDNMEKRLLEPPAQFSSSSVAAPRFSSNMTQEEFCSIVDRAKEQICAGEIIQIVLSQKFSTKLTIAPLQLYRALRFINPSPYTFFFKNKDHILIGSSPETMVKLEDNIASLRPIAGTRKRGATAAQDRMMADELLNDPKERAEHLMLVDLGRNDLGRVAKPGSVQVKKFMNIERYSHVMHLVSDAEAVLDDGFDAFDLLKAAFPAGTLSGAPKVRAMELINALESESRGVYGGAVGYFSYSGNMDLAITIRTLEITGDQLTVQTGAGIVFDSVPEKEYEETQNKAAAIFKAVQLAANDFKLEK
ncbi:MAG: chorismate-binding protein [Lentisphaeria bacterium]|nr:chorismate-binding protein [Lentisphaeria bacterium]